MSSSLRAIRESHTAMNHECSKTFMLGICNFIVHLPLSTPSFDRCTFYCMMSSSPLSAAPAPCFILTCGSHRFVAKCINIFVAACFCCPNVRTVYNTLRGQCIILNSRLVNEQSSFSQAQKLAMSIWLWGNVTARTESSGKFSAMFPVIQGTARN